MQMLLTNKAYIQHLVKNIQKYKKQPSIIKPIIMIIRLLICGPSEVTEFLKQFKNLD